MKIKNNEIRLMLILIGSIVITLLYIFVFFKNINHLKMISNETIEKYFFEGKRNNEIMISSYPADSRIKIDALNKEVNCIEIKVYYTFNQSIYISTTLDENGSIINRDVSNIRISIILSIFSSCLAVGFLIFFSPKSKKETE